MKLKYWVRLSFQVFLWSLAGCLFFFLLMLLQVSGLSSTSALRDLVGMLAPFCGLMLAIFMTSVYKLYLPLAISMGSTRKDAFFGIQLFKLLLALAFVLLATILKYLPMMAQPDNHDMMGQLFRSPLALFGYYLAISALGSLLGLLSLRFGKVGNVIMLVILAGFGGFCGYFVSSGGTAAFLSSLSVQSMTSGLLVFGVVFHLIMTIPESKAVGRCVVKL